MWQPNRNKVVWMTSTLVLFGCAITLMGAGLQIANAGHPPTPLPCAAEGVCLPNRETWGWSQTRWRPWPGDKAGLQPTQSGADTVESSADVFKPFQRPTAEQEDLRGPPPKKKESKELTTPIEESIPDLPSLDLEGRMIPRQLPSPQQSQGVNEVVLQFPTSPDANLQRSASLIPFEVESVQMLPPVTESAVEPDAIRPSNRLQEDSPPSLPASLRQLTSGLRAMGRRVLPVKIARQQVRTVPVRVGPVRVESVRIEPVRVESVRVEPRIIQQQVISTSEVIPAAWQQSADIQLINPAAAVYSASDRDELRQAIYYEAVDQ